LVLAAPRPGTHYFARRMGKETPFAGRPELMVSSKSFLRCLALVLLGMEALALARAETPATARTALVIGNSRYETAVGPLRNTDNDAKAMASALRALGFKVIERHDLSRDQLFKAVDAFRKTIPGAEVALFYYAGHGISVGGSNYLIPLKSGFDPGGADNVTLRMRAETHLFNAEQAVADMSAAGATCNIAILDACRNTPLARTGRDRGIGTGGGLAEMTPPAGSLIAFSTDAGQTALDGKGANGLYTGELLKYLRTPGLTIEQVFKRTRAAVVRRSDGSQVPAEYSRLVGDDIYLAGEASPPSPIPTPAEIPVKTAEPVNPLTAPELAKLAASGKPDACLDGLQALVNQKGPGDYAAEPLEAALESVRDEIKDMSAPSAKIVAAAAQCEKVLQLLPSALPADSPHLAPLTAKAENRLGDALLILGKPQEAMEAYQAALAHDPHDAYILYNRGRANLALGNMEAAKADFTAAANPRFDQPKARKLAQQALAGLH